MSNPDIVAELYSSLDVTFNQMIKNAQLVINSLEYWEDECGLEFPEQYQELRKNLSAALDKYQTKEKTK